MLLGIFLATPWWVPRAYRSAGLAAQFWEALPLLFLPAFVSLTYVTTFVTAKRRWRTVPQLREEKEYELEDAELHIRSQSVKSDFGWNIIQKAMITDQNVYLSVGQNQYLYFPVAAVPDMIQLVSLLTDKLGERKVEILRK